MIFQAVAAAAGVHQASNGFVKKLATKSLSCHSTLRTELKMTFFNPKFNQIPEKIWEEHSKKKTKLWQFYEAAWITCVARTC